MSSKFSHVNGKQMCSAFGWIFINKYSVTSLQVKSSKKYFPKIQIPDHPCLDIFTLCLNELV